MGHGIRDFQALQSNARFFNYLKALSCFGTLRVLEEDRIR
jgi:hypothetical protein